MNKEIKDIAMWEETDSELAKYTIQQLLKTYDDLEEQYKSLMKQIIEQNKRIDKAIEYIKETACYITDGKNKEMCVDDINYDECMELLNILRGEDND